MKNAARSGGGVDADDTDLRVVMPTAFRLANITRVSYGSKSAEFVVEIDGVGTLFVDLFTPDGREPFVAPRSIRSKFSGAWGRTFKLDAALAAAILNAFLDREERP